MNKLKLCQSCTDGLPFLTLIKLIWKIFATNKKYLFTFLDIKWHVYLYRTCFMLKLIKNYIVTIWHKWFSILIEITCMSVRDFEFLEYLSGLASLRPGQVKGLSLSTTGPLNQWYTTFLPLRPP